MIKSAIDRTLAAVGLILASPVLLAVACLVRIYLGKPVLFRQKRLGYRERELHCLKFRTMTNERDSDGKLLPDEVRLTPLGKFLRNSSLDELPQLWNVLRGDMSIVGPRPLFLHYRTRYNALQRRRHEVRPGITGWAQVKGRNSLSWEEKFQLDIWYVDHHNLLLDARIVCLTLLKVLRREGVSQKGHATMAEFMGSE